MRWRFASPVSRAEIEFSDCCFPWVTCRSPAFLLSLAGVAFFVFVFHVANLSSCDCCSFIGNHIHHPACDCLSMEKPPPAMQYYIFIGKNLVPPLLFFVEKPHPASYCFIFAILISRLCSLPGILTFIPGLLFVRLFALRISCPRDLCFWRCKKKQKRISLSGAGTLAFVSVGGKAMHMELPTESPSAAGAKRLLQDLRGLPDDEVNTRLQAKYAREEAWEGGGGG